MSLDSFSLDQHIDIHKTIRKCVKGNITNQKTRDIFYKLNEIICYCIYDMNSGGGGVNGKILKRL